MPFKENFNEDTRYEDWITCPHCGYYSEEPEYQHYVEDITEENCADCGKEFFCNTINRGFVYETAKEEENL